MEDPLDDSIEPEKTGKRGGRKSGLTRWLNRTKLIMQVVRYRGESIEGDEYTWGPLHGAKPATVRDVATHFTPCARIYALDVHGTPLDVWTDPELRQEDEDDAPPEPSEAVSEPSDTEEIEVPDELGGFTPAEYIDDEPEAPTTQVILPMPDLPETLPESARTAIVTAHAFSTMQANTTVQMLGAMLPYFERTARTASQLHELVEIQRSLSEQARSAPKDDEEPSMGEQMLLSFLTQAQMGRQERPQVPAPPSAATGGAPASVPPSNGAPFAAIPGYLRMAMESPEILTAIKSLIKKALEIPDTP